MTFTSFLKSIYSEDFFFINHNCKNPSRERCCGLGIKTLRNIHVLHLWCVFGWLLGFRVVFESSFGNTWCVYDVILVIFGACITSFWSYLVRGWHVYDVILGFHAVFESSFDHIWCVYVVIWSYLVRV